MKEALCCKKAEKKTNRGIVFGILYGIAPHSFCLAFILFSVIGAVAATEFLKKFLLIPYFLHFLILISVLLATISSALYLKKNHCLCASGIKSKWKYLASLYSATILANLAMFFIILPALANLDQNGIAAIGDETSLVYLSISVELPCSGHAALVIEEIKKNSEVFSVNFEMPDTFEIKYDPQKNSPEKIASLEIFKTYPAKIN